MKTSRTSQLAGAFDRRRWLPATLSIGTAGVMIWGLGLLIGSSSNVGSNPDADGRGRLHGYTRNTIRLAGAPAQVAGAVHRAVYLDDDAPPTDLSGWTNALSNNASTSADPRHVVILPTDPTWAMPGAYWAMFSGCPVVFAGREELGSGALERLRRHGVPAYVLAPEWLILEQALADARKLVPIHRISGSDPASHAVAIARFHDPSTAFGWGRPLARDGCFEYVLAEPEEPEYALAALPLARSNGAVLLYTDKVCQLPPETEAFLWRQRPIWKRRPADGAYRRIWILGERIGYSVQAHLDHIIEKADRLSFGPSALSPLEGALLVFMVAGWSGAIFVLVHGSRLLSKVSLGVRLAWVFTALLAPLLGVMLYLSAYRRPRINPRERYPLFLRPASIQAAAATAMGFGYCAPTMISVAYGFSYFGLPLFFERWGDGNAFLFTGGMVVMTVAMWGGAILLAWPFAQWPVHAMMSPGTPRSRLARRAFATTVLSTSAVALGMLATLWRIQMLELPALPGPDNLLWFGVMWLAAFAGFLTAWPLNYPMARAGIHLGAA